MRKFRGLLFLFCLVFVLSGCSGLRNIQDITYVSAIGMDYNKEKKEYEVYLQGLSFGNVAKTEGPRPTEPIPIYVGKASGKTLNLAVSELYKKSDPPLFFGHVESLILSQNVVKDHFNEVMEEMGRNRSLRDTLRVMTTDEKIDEVFNVKALFEYPALYTVLYKKNVTDVLEDEIRPMTLMHFLKDFYEPMGTARLPNVKIDQTTWTASKKYPVLLFNGFTIFQQRKFQRTIPFEDAVLVNWLLEKRVTLDEPVKKDGKLIATVKLSTPKMKVKYIKGSQKPQFTMNVSVETDLLEKIDNQLTVDQLEDLVSNDLSDRIKNLYEEGLKNNIDLLNVGNSWYRKHPAKFHELQKNKIFYLSERSLKGLKVEVKVFHFNSYKYNRRGDGDL